jgi:protein-L-isoaspartate(D-aspartate) O-methyltransferase
MSLTAPRAARAARFPLRLHQVSRPDSGQALSAAPAAGLGLDSDSVRLRMVQRLQDAGVRQRAVLDAMAGIRRHDFLDPALVAQAYEDTSLPIGHGQTISKPSVVARMLELLFAGAGAATSQSLGRVLEIGTGCGYQAAVLSLLATNVVSVERIKALHDRAGQLLARVRRGNVRLVFGDGMLGHPPNAPYDSIIAAAGGEHVPQAWLDQLAPNGRLVFPSRQQGSDNQVLVVIDRHAHGIVKSLHEAVNFVPLKSGVVG